MSMIKMQSARHCIDHFLRPTIHRLCFTRSTFLPLVKFLQVTYNSPTEVFLPDNAVEALACECMTTDSYLTRTLSLIRF